MRRISDGRETAVVIPVVLDPVEVRVAVRVVPVEVDHVVVAVRVAP